MISISTVSVFVTNITSIISLIVIIVLCAIPLGFGGYLFHKWKKKHVVKRFDIGIFAALICFSFGAYLLYFIVIYTLQNIWYLPPSHTFVIPTINPENNNVISSSPKVGNYVPVVYRNPQTRTVWVVDTYGNNRHQLSDKPIQTLPPVTSPDGKNVAFVSTNNEIYVVDIKSMNIILHFSKVNKLPLYVKWSPDSSAIAVGEEDTLHILSLTGIPYSYLFRNTSLVWSPDSTQYAIYYDTKQEEGEGAPNFSHVSVYNRKTNRRNDNKELTGSIVYSGGAFWSPLNNRMYFIKSGNGIGIYALYSSNVDGSDEKFLAGKSEEPTQVLDSELSKQAIYGAGSIDFSPDGKRIIVARQVIHNLNDYPLWTMFVEVLESKPIPLPSMIQDVSTVKLLSDGNHIQFTTYNGVKEEVYTTDIQGTTPVLLSTTKL